MLSFFMPKPKIQVDLDEELNRQTLENIGVVPEWLKGTLIRNGPVNFSINGQKNSHWLDGLAMLHAFTFDRGKVTYTNKFLHTEAFDCVFKKGRFSYPGFFTDRTRSFIEEILTRIKPHQYTRKNANINIAKIAGEHVALTETPLPVRFDLATLETMGVLNYQDDLPHQKCWESAHPHHDKKQGETINYLIEYGQTSFYILYRIQDGSSSREVIAKIPVQEPSYMHSFAVTENYLILTEFPFVAKSWNLVDNDQAFIKNLAWEPSRGTKFIIIDRKTGSLVEDFQTVPFFAFHHVNAFEKEGKIFVDIICYDDPSIVEKLADHYRATSEKENWAHTHLVRFVLSPKKEVLSDVIFKKFIEFPEMNEQFHGLPYRYVYLTDARDAMLINETRPIYKVDTTTKETVHWESEGCYPGEPVFIPAPDAVKEDEGIILSLVLDAKNYNSFLLLLDAQTFKEMGRVKVPQVIPPGLHSKFFYDEPLSKL